MIWFLVRVHTVEWMDSNCSSNGTDNNVEDDDTDDIYGAAAVFKKGGILAGLYEM